MSFNEAKKLFAEGLSKLQQGFDLLCDTAEPTEAGEQTGFAPIGNLAEELREAAKQKSPK